MKGCSLQTYALTTMKTETYHAYENNNSNAFFLAEHGNKSLFL